MNVCVSDHWAQGYKLLQFTPGQFAVKWPLLDSLFHDTSALSPATAITACVCLCVRICATQHQLTRLSFETAQWKNVQTFRGYIACVKVCVCKWVSANTFWSCSTREHFPRIAFPRTCKFWSVIISVCVYEERIISWAMCHLTPKHAARTHTRDVIVSHFSSISLHVQFSTYFTHSHPTPY